MDSSARQTDKAWVAPAPNCSFKSLSGLAAPLLAGVLSPLEPGALIGSSRQQTRRAEMPSDPVHSPNRVTITPTIHNPVTRDCRGDFCPRPISGICNLFPTDRSPPFMLLTAKAPFSPRTALQAIVLVLVAIGGPPSMARCRLRCGRNTGICT